MTIDPERLQAIRANAETTMRTLTQARGAPVRADADGVAWVEGFIERQRVRHGLDVEPLVSVLGAYLGEAVLAAGAGAWDETEDGALGVRFPNGDWCFPFNKVRKQFESGCEAGEGVSGFHAVAVDLAAGRGLRSGRAG
ncbi:MAG: hypothetical protein AAFR16_05320 [Pseudomonadota bacterium]